MKARQIHDLAQFYHCHNQGVGMSRDCSTLMVAQYFKRKREFVEIFIVAGSGLGIVVMSTFIKKATEAFEWRFVVVS